MASVVNNLYQNVLLAWRYGNPSWEEPVVWVGKKVEIIQLSDIHHKEKKSYKNCFLDVAHRVFLMTKNEFFSYGISLFDLAKRELTVKKGLYHSVVYYPTLFESHLFVTDPNIMKTVLSHGRNETGRSALFSGGGPTQISKIILGENLLSYDHEKHKSFKRQIAPFLKFKTSFPVIFEKSAHLTLEKWMKAPEKAPVSFLPNLIVNAICRSFFNYDEDTEEITTAVNTILSNVSNRKSTSYQKASHLLNQKVMQMIEKLSPMDLNGLKKNELVTFVKLMVFAGQDTTSALLEYLIYILGDAKDEKCFQEKIFTEWKESKKSLTVFAKESSTLTALFQEAVRLHPPSFEQTRETVNALVIEKKMFIPAKTYIHLNHLFSQRDQRRWGLHSQDFLPRRFLEAGKPIPFYPFSSGPTICLGKQFSLMLSKIFIMKLISKYTWETLSEFKKLGGSIALKISPDVQVSLTKR